MRLNNLRRITDKALCWNWGQNDEFAERREVYLWVENYNFFGQCSMMSQSGIFEFEDERDAVLFLLRWS